MELAFIASAVRRYFWIVLLVALVGILPGLLAGGGDAVYRSRGVLIIAPPPGSAPQYSSDPDRYVIGQLSVLRSPGLAAAAAELVGGGATADVTGNMVSFRHELESDIVEVTAESADPEFARDVVDAYLEAYTTQIEEQVAGERRPIDEQIGQVQGQLDVVNGQIRTTLRPLIDAQQSAPADQFLPLPGIEVIEPGLASQKEVLTQTLFDLQQERAEIDRNTRASVTGRIVQFGSLPSEPVDESSSALVAAGVVGGAFVGLLVAVVAARVSPRVLDDAHAEEILGQPVFGSFPYDRALAADRRAAVESMPDSVVRFVKSLCVRAESRASGSDALTVLIVGTRRSCGATTLAGTMASSFLSNGSAVLLIDADPDRPTLASTFIDENAPSATVRRRRSTKDRRRIGAAADTATGADLTIVRFGRRDMSSTLRRRHVSEGLAEARTAADIVVIDGGPLLAASSTLDLARQCDVVILAMPKDQKVRPLAAVSAELAGRPILPVWTPPKRRLGPRMAWSMRNTRRTGPTTHDVADGDAVAARLSANRPARVRSESPSSDSATPLPTNRLQDHVALSDDVAETSQHAAAEQRVGRNRLR